jgi:glycosyltransferase involved in cell wall biosynthesis
MTSKKQTNRPLMIAYWGRRGSLCRFALNLAEVVASRESRGTTISVSDANEVFDDFSRFGDLIFPVKTFSSSVGAFALPHRVVGLQHRLAARFARDRTRALVSLMSHVWSPLTVPVIRRAGIRHVVVVHDGDQHPGDRSRIVNDWLIREARAADRVVTLSHSVAERLVSTNQIPRRRITVLFHPDLDYGRISEPIRERSAPLRVLFMGRILPYKGLGLFVDAVELLRAKGVDIQVGVFGSGHLGNEAHRLEALGAKVDNRWIDDHEMKAVLARYDVVVLSYIAASQSGVISAAFGAGLPVVATPVGGLVEQVIPEVTGLVAAAVTAAAIADALSRLAEDRALLDRLRKGVAATAQSRSMPSFLDAIASIALD